MPITKSAKKALRNSARKAVFNVRRKETMRDEMKEIRVLVGQEKIAEAKDLLPKAYQAVDKAAKRGIIKKNTAARKKARISAFLNKATV